MFDELVVMMLLLLQMLIMNHLIWLLLHMMVVVWRQLQVEERQSSMVYRRVGQEPVF
jgi:hypothetical protein